MKIVGIIPSRYASSRFPGKPLADMLGQTMIERVYHQVKKSKHLQRVVVATDDQRIYDHVLAFGGEACMTAHHHPSGTDRCFEALQRQKEKFDFTLNIQGDEPFIDPRQIDLLCSSLTPQTELATLIQKISTLEQLLSVGEAKVVINKNQEAIYFSRSPIPFVQKTEQKKWLTATVFYRHVGLYAYRTDVLEKITKLSPSVLENAESLEQLRWIENGFKIKTVETEMEESICIDTPEDLQKAIAILKKQV
ncbi:MAG: 3-deoxy-manno-octulosonate cytidylyltransferase [Cytophagales bacterium]|jgi:3-deoxy-manno-octulosonate cytidylyltransferase (CMP-KDO synthetase)|nr:3-deoxy-manno-octulosonate cytidylyltransferase [Bacteroidota bacterium]MBS1980301.1 3-deoxy-manno-octulosonate cytidylyltransferase [Bacteroidota bacterium]WHZ08827.1 MAG: 3-deoxy-manno-octulosonate cytidylyltransferase [Cytophagales bacterium]